MMTRLIAAIIVAATYLMFPVQADAQANLSCFNSTSGKWEPCSASNPLPVTGGGGTTFMHNTGDNATSAAFNNLVTQATASSARTSLALSAADMPTFLGLTLSSLGGVGTQCVQVNNAGLLSGTGAACGIGGGGATLGSNTFTGTQTINPAANTGGLVVSAYSLTGSNASSAVSIAGTWNTSGTPAALLVNITDTASNAAAKLLDLQIASTSKFSVDKAGNTVAAGLAQSNTLTVSSLTGVLSSNGSSGVTGRTLTGTSNRITITNGDGTAGNPTFDIASAYVGQTTITTLGTIAAGTWQGTVVDPTYGGTGVNNGAKTVTLGASLSTTGAGAPTLAFPASSFTYTYPSASKTLMASDYSNGTTLTSNAFLTGGGAGAAPNAVVITGLVLGAGASAPAAYAGTSCTNQFPRSLNASGAATCASVATADFTGQLALAKGGTNADLSATGGTSQFLKQATSGAAITVVRPAQADISGLTTADSPTFTGLTLSGLTGILSSNAGTGVAARTLTGTASRLTITNGDGTAGNPTFDISSSYVGQATITTLGTIATGVWQGTKVGLAYGGTNADLSATGGTSQFLKQATSGAAITVVQPTFADIGSGTTAATATGLTISGGTLSGTTTLSGIFSGDFASSSGLLAGNTSRLTVGGLAVNQNVQSVGTNNGARFVGLRFEASSSPYYLQLGRSRGTVSTAGAVANGDQLFSINAMADDGSANGQVTVTGATIVAVVNGTVSTGIVPTDLSFATRNGAGTFAERMRLFASGGLFIGTPISDPGVGNLLVSGSGQFNNKALIYPTTTPTTVAGANQLQIGEQTQNAGYHLDLGYYDNGTGYTGSIQVYANSTTIYPLSLNPSGGNIQLGSGSYVVGFGGLTSSFPGLARSGTTLQVRLADGSADGPISASTGTFSGAVNVNGASGGGPLAIKGTAAALGDASGWIFSEDASLNGFTIGYDSSLNRTWIYSRTRGTAARPISLNDAVIIPANGTGLTQFAGTTSAFPALKRSGTTLQHRLADDSADGPMSAAAATFSGVVTSGVASSVQGYLRLLSSSGVNHEGNVYSDNTNGGIHMDTAGNTYPIQIEGSGVVIGNPTGGAKGYGTINPSGSYYINGTAGLASKTCTINTANAATGITITITGGIITATTTC